MRPRDKLKRRVKKRKLKRNHWKMKELHRKQLWQKVKERLLSKSQTLKHEITFQPRPHVTTSAATSDVGNLDIVNSRELHVYEPGMCARRLTHYMYQQQHRPEDHNIEFWRNFVTEYFAPNARKKWCVSLYGNGRHTTGVFPQDVWHCEI